MSRESQISLSFQFRLGRATVSNIIFEYCEATYQALSEKYLQSPTSPEEWKTIAQQFEYTWNMPHVIICAIDEIYMQSMRNMFELNVQKTLEAHTTTKGIF